MKKRLERISSFYTKSKAKSDKEYGWRASKFHDKLSDISEDEGRTQRAYLITDGDSYNKKGDKDIDIPYFVNFSVENSDVIPKLMDIDSKFEAYVRNNAKMSYGDSGGMMPYGDANIPNGAIPLFYEGKSDDVEMQWELDWCYDIAKKVDKKVTPQSLAQYMLDADRVFWKPDYKQSDVDKIKKPSDLGRLSVLAYEPVDTVIGIYIYEKDVKKYFAKNKNPEINNLLEDLKDEVE